MTSNRETARYWLAQMRRQLEDQKVPVRALERNAADQLVAAQCNICLLVWERPADLDDEAADHDLGQFVQDHKTRHQAR